MAPLPKPRGQRVKGGPQPQWRELPAAGRVGKAPALPGGEWLAGSRAWWATIWRSPMAVAWIEADVDSLVRLARMRDDFHRGELPVSAFSAMQQLEDRFGLSPKARRMLQWEISKAGEVAKRPAEVRGLRAV